MQHSFDIEIATKYGVDEAIFVKNIAYWVLFNKANGSNLHDERYWTYNKVDAFAELFPYWSNRQLERIIKSCVQKDLILKGNYNSNSHDRTCWYTLTDNAAKLLIITISPNGEMQYSKRGNGNHQMVKCSIANIKPNIKPTKRDTPKKSLCPPILTFSDRNLELAKEFDLDIHYEFEKMKDWSNSKGEYHLNWNATLNNWLKRAHEQNNKSKLSSSLPSTASQEPIKTNYPSNNQTRCTVMSFDDPNHPTNIEFRRYEEKLAKERLAKEQSHGSDHARTDNARRTDMRKD